MSTIPPPMSLSSYAGPLAPHPTIWKLVKALLLYGQRLFLYPTGFFNFFGGIFDTPNVEIPTPDGVILRGLFLKHPDSKATVIMFHGNGEYVPSDTIRDYFSNTLLVNVLALSYRGYGMSTGVPSERGLKIDAQTALDYVLGLDFKIPVVIFGHSLGGAVAIHLTARNPDKIRALIINNTFLSVPEIIRTRPKIGVFSFLCTQKWNSRSKIANIPSTIPILMLSGGDDHVVPPEHMKRLWAIRSKKTAGATPAPNDTFVLFPHCSHNDNEEALGFFNTITMFLAPLLELDSIAGSDSSSNASKT